MIEELFKDRLPEFYETLAFHFKNEGNKGDVGAADKAAIQRVKVPPYSASGGLVSDT